MQLHPPTKGQLEQLLVAAEAHPPEVALRLRWFLCFLETNSVSETCRRFSIARTTFYRWSHRFDANDLTTLRDPVVVVPERVFSPQVEAQTFAPEEPVVAALQTQHPAVAAQTQVPTTATVQSFWQSLRRPLIVTSMVVQILLLVGFVGMAVLEAHSTENIDQAKHDYEMQLRQDRMQTECRGFLEELDASRRSIGSALARDDERMRIACEQVLNAEDNAFPHTNTNP